MVTQINSRFSFFADAMCWKPSKQQRECQRNTWDLLSDTRVGLKSSSEIKITFQALEILLHASRIVFIHFLQHEEEEAERENTRQLIFTASRGHFLLFLILMLRVAIVEIPNDNKKTFSSHLTSPRCNIILFSSSSGPGNSFLSPFKA